MQFLINFLRFLVHIYPTNMIHNYFFPSPKIWHFLTLWLVEEVGMTVPEAVEVDSLQHSKFACNSGSHID